ncbi:Glycinol 4-dimethylallyltransferase, partial [Mucuna pruriens]
SFASKASQHKRKTQIEYGLSRFQQLSLNHQYKCIEGGSTYQECSRKYIPKAYHRESFDSEPHASHPKNILDSIKKFLVALYWFCYPYTMIGRALVPYLFMDFYTNGVNQLFDIEIDKINKPHLPLASGQLSFTTGVIIVASSVILVSYKLILFYNNIFKINFIDKVEGDLLFYSLLQSFWLSWIIGSWPLIWSLVSFFFVWSGYSI